MSLDVSAADAAEDPPQLGTDESYTLTIPGGSSGQATLSANTVYTATSTPFRLSRALHSHHLGALVE